MLSQESELHLIKTSIFLKKVAITVRFPCSISFALKNEQNLVDHRSSYELVKGQCIINHGIEIELEIPCFRGKYEEKKIGLLIYMVSANGKIPAGSVTINPVEKTVVDKKSYLQKCPDKNAYAVYTGSFERVKILRSNHEKGRLSNLASSTVSGINQIRRSSFHQSSGAVNKEEQIAKSPEQEPLSSPRELSLSNLKVVQSKQYEDDLTASQGLRKMTFPALPKLRLDELGRRNTLGSIERDFQSKRSRVSSRNGDENDWQIQAQKSRIKTLEKQKTTYIKQISKLRSSMAKVDSQRRYQPDLQTNLDMHYNKDLQEELQRLKEKTRSQQKKERQSTNMMHQLREELDKKKSKIYQLDSSRNKIENQLSEKDRIINQLQSQKRKLVEALDEEKSQSISFSKRFDLKENSYKDQIKKLSEKVAQIDSQRQKAVLDYNILLGQIQSSEKRHQLSLREKEKIFSDQKLKLSKRNDQLNSQLTTLKEKLLEYDNSFRQYDSLKKKIDISQRQQNQAKKTLNQENEAVKNLLKISEQEKQKLKEELEATEQQYSNQKNTLKKKISQQNQQIFSLKQKHEKAQKSLILTESKLRQLQNRSLSLQKQRKSLFQQLQDLRKKIQKKQNQQQSRQKMTQTLSVQNSNHNIKLSQLKSKIESQKKKFEQMQAKYQQQVKYLIGTKELLANQLQQMKWQLEKQKQKYLTLNVLHRELGEQNISLNHQIIHLEQRLAQIEQEKEEKSNQVSILQQKILNLQQVINQNISLLQSKMKISEDQYNRVCSEKQSITQKFVVVENKIIQAQNYHQYLMQACQGLESHLKARDEHIKKLESQAKALKNEVENLSTDVNFKNNEIVKLKQNVKNLEKDITTHIICSQTLRQQIRQNQDKFILLKQQNKRIQSELLDLKKENSKAKLQMDDYRKRCIDVMQQLIDYFGRQKNIGESLKTLHSFPDSKLSSLLIQNLIKIAEKRKKMVEELDEHRNATTYLENQLAKLQTYSEKIEEEHLQFVTKSQQQLNKVIQEKNTKIEILQQKLRQFSQKADDNKNELSFYNAQNEKYQNAINLLNQQIAHKEQTQSQLRLQVTKLQNQLYELKQKQIKKKLAYSTQADELKQILILQQERNEQLANSYRGELQQKQKWLHEKMEQLRKALLIQQQYRLFRLSKDQQIKDCQILIEHQKQSKLLLERTLKDKQRIIQQIQAQVDLHKHNIHQLTISLSLEQQSKQTISTKYRSLQQSFLLFKNEQSNKTTNLQQSDKRQRQSRQKIQSQKQSIENQNKELRQKNIRLESQNQFYRFYKEQSMRKIEQLERTKNENYQQLIKSKQTSLRLQKEMAAQMSKIYKNQMDYQIIVKQRDYINEQNSKLKEKMNDLQDRSNQISKLLSEGDVKNRQLNRLSEKMRIIEQQHDKQLQELKGTIIKLKQDIAYKQNRIKQLENQIQFSSSDLNAEKQKWKTELQNEKNIYQLKLETIEDNIIVLQNQLEFQREQAVKEIEGANGIIQELNEVIREKEEMIEYKEEVIGEQAVRLEELHTQLNQCVGKWQKQKQVYLPTSSRLNQIRQQINRMNKFIGDLDGRNKQLLEINKRKLQQTFDNKPCLTEILKELNIILQKSKNRIINRCTSQKEKEGVIAEFKGVQEKLDIVLKSMQVVAVKN